MERNKNKDKKKKYKTPKVKVIKIDQGRIETSSGGCCCGGCCPFVYVWDGLEYMKDNNILPGSENLGLTEKEITDYYVLQAEPKIEGGKIKIRIREDENELSWFNDFKLLTVEHPKGYRIGVTPGGELVSYKEPKPPISCTDKNGKDCLELVSNTNWRHPEKFYITHAGDVLEIYFGKIQGENLKFIIVDPEDKEPFDVAYKSILIYLHIANTEVKVDVLHAREKFYPDVVDLTHYLPQIESELTIKLKFTQGHKIAFVGIDTPEALDLNSTTNICNFIKAQHTELGDITQKMKNGSLSSIKLVPNQEIDLTFPVLKYPNRGNKLSYILFSKGYYVPVTKIWSIVSKMALPELSQIL